MAFDRYVAICSPLRYATIMTGRMVVTLSVSAWMVIFLLTFVLVALSVRLSRCRRVVLNPFCDNPSLFKLSCENLLINNIYGLGYSVVLLGSSLGSVALTYLKIAIVCLSSKNKSANIKALQTCASHIASYVLLLMSGFIIVILHRFPHLSDNRKLASILFHVSKWLAANQNKSEELLGNLRVLRGEGERGRNRTREKEREAGTKRGEKEREAGTERGEREREAGTERGEKEREAGTKRGEKERGGQQRRGGTTTRR
ncbi:Olfactory receptor 51I2 [Liparis tanakae]|uniref:Olfactory receptor 51I2 n=1 Tax=Liparis tanakae TaxID=230148 RepID=A0A4Z2G306_9TELE|nr:Olfactory receptor 51I2 [Liparis tanakae]